tara:strand:- start:8956 stop:9204 length:249 start_codon:yes stop_codon:yes gene_type:complete
VISDEHQRHQGGLDQSYANQRAKAKGTFPGAAGAHRSALRRMCGVSSLDGEILLQFKNEVAHVRKVRLRFSGYDLRVREAVS